MSKIKQVILYSGLSLAGLWLAFPVFGQPGNPTGGPVGGGLVFLLLSGLALGIVKLYRRKKE
jgi:hypothetical protein